MTKVKQEIMKRKKYNKLVEAFENMYDWNINRYYTVNFEIQTEKSNFALVIEVIFVSLDTSLSCAFF